MVVVDRLSKMVHFVPTTTTATAVDTARLLVDHVVKLHGQPPSAPLYYDDEGLPWHEVEDVLQHKELKRGKRTVFQYLIKWKGYGHEHNTWEPEANLKNCPELLTDYWASVRSKDDAKQHKKKDKARKRVKAKRTGKLKRTVA